MSTAGPVVLPPDLRSRLRGLRLLPRHAAVARGIGQHASRNRGAGLEFVQYRSYEPGDELRQVDWKLYARSDRFFVREAERESPSTVWILLDATASMQHRDQARPAVQRLDAARTLAACIVELALQQNDAFGLAIAGGKGLQLVPPGGGPRQRDRVLLALQRAQAHGRWPDATRLRPLWERVGQHDLLLMIGDGFDEEAIALLLQMARAGRDVLHLQLLGADERDFPFRTGHRFIDPETGETLLADADAVRAEYLQRFGAACAALDARLQAAGIRHARGGMDQSPDLVLRQLLRQGAGR